MMFPDQIRGIYYRDPDLMMDFPLALFNETNQMLFEERYHEIQKYWISDQTMGSWSWSLPLFCKGLIVTHVMPSIYIFIILISLPLNALALVMFCRIREKKPAVIYMSHLAFVDLLFTLLLPLKIHYRMNASNWAFGEACCRLLNAAYYGNMYCSVLLMMCMSVDRLLVVAFPIASLSWRSAGKATGVCVGVWLLTLAGTVPLLTMNQTTEFDGGTSCFDIWADPSVMSYVLAFFVLLCICFVLPLVVIIVSYSVIIYLLCTKRVRSSSSTDKRRRSAVLATAVLIEFLVCFAPSNALLLYHCVSVLKGGVGWDTYPPYLLAVCLGSSNVFLDPLLYYYGSSEYRQKIRSLFVCFSKAKDTITQKSSCLRCTVKPEDVAVLANIRPTQLRETN
ncbi:proteinase-activated receptor 1-like [Puntigrus tetrazona]|uniref:proteinase-activated receptor 1-like n=1 Tax=Puntigrus tetrazona TaxID=1606681 RepID=UPI001C8A14DA|nr:proteinase-activated receptor 1-like [Puntigrus tetrazona]